MRHDLNLTINTWAYFGISFILFLILSHFLKVDFLWSAITGGVIYFLSYSAWISFAFGKMGKQYIKKSLYGLLFTAFKKRSFSKALEEMFNFTEDMEAEIEAIVQGSSRWLMIVPFLLLFPTIALNFIPSLNLNYLLIAEVYFLIVGFIGMITCRRGYLCLSAFVFVFDDVEY